MLKVEVSIESITIHRLPGVDRIKLKTTISDSQELVLDVAEGQGVSWVARNLGLIAEQITQVS